MVLEGVQIQPLVHLAHKFKRVPGQRATPSDNTWPCLLARMQVSLLDHGSDSLWPLPPKPAVKGFCIGS